MTARGAAGRAASRAPIGRSVTYWKKPSLLCSPSATTSMPAPRLPTRRVRDRGALVPLKIAGGVVGCAVARARITSSSACGRARLPTWVVRMRSSLRFTLGLLFAQAACARRPRSESSTVPVRVVPMAPFAAAPHGLGPRLPNSASRRGPGPHRRTPTRRRRRCRSCVRAPCPGARARGPRRRSASWRRPRRRRAPPARRGHRARARGRRTASSRSCASGSRASPCRRSSGRA